MRRLAHTDRNKGRSFSASSTKDLILASRELVSDFRAFTWSSAFSSSELEASILLSTSCFYLSVKTNCSSDALSLALEDVMLRFEGPRLGYSRKFPSCRDWLRRGLMCLLN